MASIKISELNQDELGMLSNLTDEELAALYGGGWIKDLFRKIKPVVDFAIEVAPVVIAFASAV
jgi:hypothetical protein